MTFLYLVLILLNGALLVGLSAGTDACNSSPGNIAEAAVLRCVS